MNHKPITLRPDASLVDAVNLLTSQPISCIPVVDNDRIPVGIVSWRDVLKALVATQ